MDERPCGENTAAKPVITKGSAAKLDAANREEVTPV